MAEVGLSQCLQNLVGYLKSEVPDALNYVMDEVLNQTYVPDIDAQLQSLCAVQTELQKKDDELAQKINKFTELIGSIDTWLGSNFCPWGGDFRGRLGSWRDNLQKQKDNLGLTAIQNKIIDLNTQKLDAVKTLKLSSKINQII